MVMLTRRRDPDAGQESWLVYYGDVHVGTIAVRSGIPHDQVPWGWRCGFYPGSEPGECTSGTAATFDQGASRLRVRLARVLVEAHRGRFPGLARSARLDGGEISALRPRRARAA